MSATHTTRRAILGFAAAGLLSSSVVLAATVQARPPVPPGLNLLITRTT